MTRHLCIHAHFYQPPRENPWLGEVEVQDSARPYHDWNERIAAECYQRNAASRILDDEGRIARIVNNYARISFNFGPTLLSWMERRRPDVYAAVREADRDSRRRFSGHGAALAQAYNHVILPLADARDKRTQVRWGIADFEHRFGRPPEGLWLPETAVDLETLEVLARHGLRFTILAPGQARRARRLGHGRWRDVEGGRIDPRRPYLCRLPSGRSIALFFYDGPVARDVAFGDLLRDGARFARRLGEAFDGGRREAQLVHVATDGETYGHHHRFGDMALAYCLRHLELHGTARLTVYGEYLEAHPPTHEVEIQEHSSWSCAHGVERWRSHCGCSTGAHPGWDQAWRAPLRRGLDGLRDALAALYEREAAPLLRHPWEARDDYIRVVLDRSEPTVRAFLDRHGVGELRGEDKVRALKLLELQHNALLMYTSCGWFFDDISGIEAVQILGYAARAAQLAREVGGNDPEPALLEALAEARSNLGGTGADVYRTRVAPARVDLLRVGAHFAVSSLFDGEAGRTGSYAFEPVEGADDRLEAGHHRLALGAGTVRSLVTGEALPVSYAVLHLGDHVISAGVRPRRGEAAFAEMGRAFREAFLRSDVAEVFRLQTRHFGRRVYSLRDLFRDAQRAILDRVRYATLDRVEGVYRALFQDNYALMSFLRDLGVPVPAALRAAAEQVVGADLVALFRGDGVDPERLARLLEEERKWGLRLDWELIGYVAGAWIDREVARWARRPEHRGPLESLRAVLEHLGPSPAEPDLWRAQNAYAEVAERLPQVLDAVAARPGGRTEAWHAAFTRVGELLGVRTGG
ncbi:MAG: DUF3536 domain-containing protein [Deferrisomatales bacterium]